MKAKTILLGTLAIMGLGITIGVGVYVALRMNDRARLNTIRKALKNAEDELGANPFEMKLRIDGADTARTQLNNIKSGIKMFQLQIGALPSDLSELREKPTNLRDPTRWKGPYFDLPIPDDPWGNAYTYQTLDKGFELRSAGADGVMETHDDVVVSAGAY